MVKQLTTMGAKSPSYMGKCKRALMFKILCRDFTVSSRLTLGPFCSICRRLRPVSDRFMCISLFRDL